MTDERKKEIRALADAATPGPWDVHHSHDQTGYPCYYIHGVSGAGKRDERRLKANASLMEAARTAVPEMLDHIEELEVKIERQRLRYIELTEELRSCNSDYKDLQYRMKSLIGSLD
jgi:hypothetical protein